jgi:hypothetical protein
MYPGHQEAANRLMYVVINGIFGGCVTPFLDSPSIIPVILLNIAFIVNLYIFAGNLLAEIKSWFWLIASGLYTVIFLIFVMVGLRFRL